MLMHTCVMMTNDLGKGKFCKRVDRKRCTIRPCLGHKSLQNTREIQRWSKSSIFVRSSNHFLDQNCERCWKVRLRGNADPRRRRSFGETRCKGETSIETVINKQLELYSDGTEKMNRHWSKKIQWPFMLPDVKIHCSISSTQGSWSRRRCRSSLYSKCWEMQGSSITGFKILARRNKRIIKRGSVLVSGEVDRRSVKRWWTEGKVSILFETKLSRNTPVPSSQSRSFRKNFFWKCSCQSCIAR